MLASSASVPINIAATVTSPAPAPLIAAPTSNANSTEEDSETRSEGAPDSLEVPESETVNVWPDEAAESVFLAESRAQRGTAPSELPAPVLDEEVNAKPLPSLDALVEKIPAESRELLDELFRAKFTKVKRVKQSDLKAVEP